MGLKRKERLVKIKKVFLGMNFSDGLLFKILIYTLLISFAYVYLYPILFMLVNSFKSLDDLINQGVKWVPTKLEFLNYQKAWKVLGFPNAIYESVWHTLKLAFFSTVTAALAGYGFATFKFPFKKTLMALMLIAFVLPPQVLMVSIMDINRKLGIASSEYAMIVPAILGQGLNQSIFILIFYQFFKQTPEVLRESAEIDGASQFKIFYKIALPSALPSIIIVFLFAFVWYWNETFVTSLYTNALPTIPLKISRFVQSYQTLYPPGTPGNELNEAIKLAGHMLAILPLLMLYFFMQRYFVESVDRSGIAGE